jgi:hypothetical protein
VTNSDFSAGGTNSNSNAPAIFRAPGKLRFYRRREIVAAPQQLRFSRRRENSNGNAPNIVPAPGQFIKLIWWLLATC